MPDKSKRRKNKNKRKNKNPHQDSNKSGSEVNKTTCHETSVGQNIVDTKCEQETNSAVPSQNFETNETFLSVDEALPSSLDECAKSDVSKNGAVSVSDQQHGECHTKYAIDKHVPIDTNYTTEDRIGTNNEEVGNILATDEVIESHNLVVTEKCVSENDKTTDNIARNDDQIIDVSDVKLISANLIKFENENQPYVVESPENSLKDKSKCRLDSGLKSKSLDNDDAPKIVELSDESNMQSEDDNSLAIIECNNVLVSDVESDIEWEKTDEIKNDVPLLKELATSTLSVASIPLNVIQYDQNKGLSPEAEISLRNYLNTLNLSTQPSDSSPFEIKTEIEHIITREIKQRLRKRAMADDFLFLRPGPPRVLDVIDEEGSSESSATSRRHSHLSDKKSEADDLEDDVFEDDINLKEKIKKYSSKSVHNLSSLSQIPQKCMLVGAKIKNPENIEARGDWKMQTIEKMSGAEVVYLTDTSSSTSSVRDLDDDTEEGVETDASIRMITPTIEITDTEKFLKNTFCPQDVVTVNDDVIDTDINTTLSSPCNGKTQGNSYLRDHEIVVLSTENITTNLYVKDIPDNKTKQNNDIPTNEETVESATKIKPNGEYDLEIKVLKCELNDAMNNLVKEYQISSDAVTKNENQKDCYTRQDSSSSVCSSQCTAKYNPTYSSLNDVSNLHDDTCDVSKVNEETHSCSTSHVKDVFECVTGASSQSDTRDNLHQPPGLRDLCVKKITTLPFGDKILEELASVSTHLQNITLFGTKTNDEQLQNTELCKNQNFDKNMPYYPLPDISSIESVSLGTKQKSSIPPPLQPRNSSLKKPNNEHWTGLPTKTEPVFLCLSPSQKMLMEKTNTVITKENASQLVDMHKKFVDRRGYNESIKNITENNKNPPVIPFKSQTGSRLLALIRDPTTTNNLSKDETRRTCNYKSSDQIVKTYSRVDQMSKRIQDQFNSINEYSILKPIPPPRTKKYSSAFYESDESSDFTDSSFKSLKSERKFFHYSTGTLNKDIENDISSIQNMHKYCTSTRDRLNAEQIPRRPSLPKDLCDQQMEYIRKKEKEVEEEIRRLEQEKLIAQPERKGPRAPLISEKEVFEEKSDNNCYYKVHKKDFSFNHNDEKGNKTKFTSAFSSSQEEIQRDKMYSEYMSQMAERQERRQQKIIKITNYPVANSKSLVTKSMPALDDLDSKVNNRIEKEFICKARERWEKLGIKDPETEDEKESSKDVYQEPKQVEHKIKVIEGDQEKDVQKLPNHLQDFVRFTAKDKNQGASSSAVWRPGAPTPPPGAPGAVEGTAAPPPPPPPPVWTPSSAGPSPQLGRKSFRPVHFEETPPARRKFYNTEQNGCTSGSESEGRLRTSHSAPASGLNSLGSPGAGRLPRAQNPTVTLLQKAREGQIPRGASYLQQERDSARLPRDRPSPPRGDPVYALRKEYASEGEADRSEYERRGVRKMADAHRKVDGIGPTTKEGMPVALRSEVKDPSKWYKKMYDTIHKNKYDDDYVTIRYKNHRGDPPKRVTNKSQYAYFDPRSGYLSEPEGHSRLGSSTWSDAYDSDVTTGHRRRTASVQEDRKNDITSPYLPSNKYSTLASARASQEVYKNQPGRIEDYVPGKSSVIDKESKQWWDEVMDIFDGWLDENSPLPPYTTLLARAIQKSQNISSTTSLPQASPKEKKDITSTILSKSNMARALKESGYESDSTLIFRRREEADGPLSPAERRAAYKDLQAGGEPPLRGFRSPAPPRTDESEIEYIPISPTLTKIRVHKKSPKLHEVICYPVTNIETNATVKFKKQLPSFLNLSDPNQLTEYPPAPPRRISSRNSRTLKLVTSTRPASMSPKRSLNPSQSNVAFLKNKISNKLTRQNTHIIAKRNSVPNTNTNRTISKGRIMSVSAPPAINRKNISRVASKSAVDPKPQCTSSFGSPRRTLQPTEYNSARNKYGEPNPSVLIEGGAGRRTPISNILDKVTSLDKLWSSEKRNERIDLSKVKSKSVLRTSKATTPKAVSSSLGKTKSPTSYIKSCSPSAIHKSRDMTRTAEKVQRLKISGAKSNPCLSSKNEAKSKVSSLKTSTITKSSSNLSPIVKNQNQIKTAVVTTLKKKKPLDNIGLRPRSVPCHESCSKKSKDATKDTKKSSKIKTNKQAFSKTNDSELGSQFGDTCSNTSNFGSIDNITKRSITAEEIERTRDAVKSDAFFQHLFFGNQVIPTIAYSIMEPSTAVLQKTKLFQSYPQSEIAPKSLNSYLIHRKPVSLSRFKIWDKQQSPSRARSPRSISWPGRTNKEVKKIDSLVQSSDYGSTSSLATVRSKSEPPVNKMFFSQTSRPKSPVVVFYKKPRETTIKKEVSPTRIIFSQTSRPISPVVTHNVKKPITLLREKSKSPSRIVFTETVRPVSPIVTKRIIPDLELIELYHDDDDRQPSKLYFSQTSRPVSPKVIKRSTSRSKSNSPVSIRSPSYRRIYSSKQGKPLKEVFKKSIIRTRSAGDADKNASKPARECLLKTQSDSNLRSEDPDYEEYIQDMQNTKIRSERFRELNRYYSLLERVGELEKTTSTCDLRHRKKDEEIIDFDRWKKIRAIERAEEELNSLYEKLKLAQNEKDFLFYPRDIKDFRWNHDRDRGLRIKEKSVEDLKDHFQQVSYEDFLDLDQLPFKDTYKPLWRGTSVAETAFNINRKNETNQKVNPATKKPVIILHQDTPFAELRKKIGLGSRLWSSLSMEQVNALKKQLNAIYSKELESKSDKEHYIVDVQKDTKTNTKPFLHVRCNSLITPPISPKPETELNKSESIAAIPCPITSVKELKNNVNKIQMSLTESEKRKISQTISKEVLDKISKFENTHSPVSLKEELEICQRDLSINKIKETKILKIPSVETGSKTEEESSKEISGECTGSFVCVSEKTDSQYVSSASETETGSSDVSNKTVIYRGPKKEVQKKVEYFEAVKNMLTPPKTVYHARENSDEKLNKSKNNANDSKTDSTSFEVETNGDNLKPKIIQSQSCSNFKELFGESEKNKFLSLPSKPEIRSRSPSPRSEVYVQERRTPDTLRCSSDETIWRSRSPSPDPERYWRAYLNLARAGEVRRLARRFDSPTAAAAVLRRHRSDPELARNKWPSEDRIYGHRNKKCTLPVARVPLRTTNRYMPHIDIISKLASLRRRTTPRSRSAEEPSECRAGEVERIRRRFETMSILGQIYASAPDVSELRDIAPYLAGSWIAHRYPKRSDNNRSITDPSILNRGRTSPVKKEIRRVARKEPVKLSSILKSDTFVQQEFDPALHRPASRYEPPRAPPRPPPASWPYRLAPFITPSRHTVTFQETDSVPEPPRRTAFGSLSDTESPRRYVESDVNIHYRVPVRQDPLPLVPERELARQQAEHMKRLYREQKRNKYLQENDISPMDIEAFDASIKELQDMQSRRHQDNFLPNQKNILPLNRYDEAEKIVARALYAFNGQTSRELSFRKGDLIHVRRQIDANWYEGELHGRIGLFPYNYVEIMKGDLAQSPRKPSTIEGRARAKFDFTAQTNLELALKKGELVVLTRRIDHNWWEGRNAHKTGIFPDSYVTVLQEPSQSKPEAEPAMNANKPAASPAAHGLVNGGARRSMGPHSYTPQLNSPALSNAPQPTQPLPGYTAKPAQATLTPSERGYGPPTAPGVDLNNTEPLYVDTNAEAVPYRAMYKYRPQNPDELELNEGDTVYVLERCDDGWYVGSSQRTGRFGTFPGNYVERI